MSEPTGNDNGQDREKGFRLVVTNKGEYRTAFMLWAGKELCHGGVILLKHSEFTDFVASLKPVEVYGFGEKDFER